LRVNPDDLRHYYDSLSDEALLELDRATLTEVARQCYDDELAQRKLNSRDSESPVSSHAAVTPPGKEDGGVEIDDEYHYDTGPKPDWLDDAACACSFSYIPGDVSADDAQKAHAALLAAGIPCYVAEQKIERARYEPELRYEYAVMVPGARNLAAISVLDKELFNPKVEADWKIHLETLSDEDLRALNSETICAGLLDRMNRLKRVYGQEIARRSQSSPGSARD
jgi:hypothetical protein